MFVERLKKEQIIAIFDRLGLFGENADKAYLKYGKIGKLVSMSTTVNDEVWVNVAQFNNKGTIYTPRNTSDNDKTFANCYLLSDFAIEPAQDNLTKKDYNNIQNGYRRAMLEIFGEEYLDAREEYNHSRLMARGFDKGEKRSFYSYTYSNEEGTTIQRSHKHQIARAMKAKEKLEAEQQVLVK